MFAGEKQNEESTKQFRLERNRRGSKMNNCLSKNSSNHLFEKVEKLFEKTDRGLELAGTSLLKNGQGNIRLGLVS